MAKILTSSDAPDRTDAGKGLSGPVPETSESAPIAETFQRLTSEWKKGRGASSSLSVVKSHPAYQEIIRMGMLVVPYIMDELEERPDFWFAAPREITGQNPVPPESAGRVREMAQAWLKWGRANNVRR